MSKEYPCVYYDREKCTLHGKETDYIDWCVMGPCSKETPSNADHIRSMSDEELATILYSVFNIDDLKIPFCKNKPECNELMDADKEIPESMCLRCMLDWLKRPYKEDEFG